MMHSETLATPTHRLAFYDMDKTITRHATFGPFIRHVLRHHAPLRAVLLPVMGVVTLGYALGLVTRSRLKEINLGLLLGRRIDMVQANRIAAGFARQTVADNILPQALARIAADRAGGFRIILATASYRFYVAAIARELAIDDVIATDCVALGTGRFLPRIDGENCYDTAKLRKVEAWMNEQKIVREQSTVRFYSDHISDAPCLAWADEGHATNPHPPLRKMAAQRGWPVHDWAKDTL